MPQTQRIEKKPLTEGTVRQLANPRCRRCAGRGFTSRDGATKKPIACVCVIKELARRKNAAESKQDQIAIDNAVALGVPTTAVAIPLIQKLTLWGRLVEAIKGIVRRFRHAR